jgi:hypothetical protein
MKNKIREYSSLFLMGKAEVRAGQVQNYIKTVERHLEFSDVIMGRVSQKEAMKCPLSNSLLSHKHKKSPAYYHAATFTTPDNGYIAGISQRQQRGKAISHVHCQALVHLF